MRKTTFGAATAAMLVGVLAALTGAVGAVGLFDGFDDPLVAPPVPLCVGAKSAVSPTAAGVCPKNTTLVRLADARAAEDLRSRIETLAGLVEDVTGRVTTLEANGGDSSDLADRVAALESAADDYATAAALADLSGRLDDIEERLAALEPERGTLVLTPGEGMIVPGFFRVRVVGALLEPGSIVQICSDSFGDECGQIFTVAADGTVDFSHYASCVDDTNLHYKATDQQGDEVTSNTIALGPGCAAP